MSNIVEADYQIIQERTLPVIISEIKIIEQRVIKETMEGAVQIGLRLQEAKEKVGHGNFGQWCKENLNYSQDTAQKFMRLAKEYGDPDSVLANTAMSRNFSISNALSLLKLPEEDREKFVEEHPIEDMTNKALEDEIRKLKEEKATLEEEVTEVARDRAEIDGRLSEAEAEVQKLQEQLASAAIDSEKLEKLNEKYEKAKEKLKKEKNDRQKEIDAAIEKERQGIIEQVNAEAAGRMEQIAGENDELREKLTETERRLERAARGTVIQFKVLTDQLQDIFEKCGELIINEADQETADKMNGALRLIVEQFMEEL